MPFGMIGSAAYKAAKNKRREPMPQVPIERLLPPQDPVQDVIARAPMPSRGMMAGVRSAAKMAPGLAGDFDTRTGKRGAEAEQIAPMMDDPAALDPMAPRQKPAPITMGTQANTREQAKMAGMIGSAAPKKQGGILEMFGYDPEGTGMEPLEWLFSDREKVEAARGRTSAAEQKRQFEESLDQLGLSGPDRIRAQMDPEGFFRSMNEVQAANMKPQTDTFYDPVSKQWMRKPQGPMAVADGTDIFDPESNKTIYSNLKEPDPIKPATLPEGMWYGPDGKGPPQPIPGYVGMRTQIARGSQSPSASGDTYRPATPEDRAKWGLPPEGAFKINERTGEPAAISGARAAQDFSPTEIRGFRDQADGLYILKNAVNQYVAMLEKMGGPQLLDTPFNAENSQALKSAHGLITEAIKDAGKLGALDQGVQNLVNAIIQEPVGWGTFGKSTDSIKQAANQLNSSIDFKLSRVPEEYRAGSTGELPGAGEEDDDDFLDTLFGRFGQIAEAGAPSAADMGDDELKAMLGLD